MGCGVMTLDDVTTKVLSLMPISDDDVYASQVRVLTNAAINKLRIEGVDINATDKEGNNIFLNGSGYGDDYCLCVTYQVMKDIDFDTDMNFLTEQYITRVNTLRCNITLMQR